MLAFFRSPAFDPVQGLGGLVVVLLAVFLGVDPSQVLPQQPALPPGAEQSSGYDLSKCKTLPDKRQTVKKALATPTVGAK